MAPDQIARHLSLRDPTTGRAGSDQARPDIGGGEILEAAIEFGPEHRPPEVVKCASSSPAGQPLLDADLLQTMPVAMEIGGQDRQAQARAIYCAQEREGHEIPQRRHRIQATFMEKRRACSPEAEPIRDPQLCGQLLHMGIAGEDRVIETIDLHIAQSDGPGQATDLIAGFIQNHRMPGPAQKIPQAHADNPAADHCNTHRILFPLPPVGFMPDGEWAITLHARCPHLYALRAIRLTPRAISRTPAIRIGFRASPNTR